MALTPTSTPDGFQPVGTGALIYAFTEASIAGKPNYRIEIEFNGLTLPVSGYSVDANLQASIDIAPLLRGALTMSPTVSERFKNTYVKYQAVWDGGSDAQVPLSGNVIYFYIGSNNNLNKRAKVYVDTSGGKFLTPDRIPVIASRTAYVDFLRDSSLGNVSLIVRRKTGHVSTNINSIVAGAKLLVSSPFGPNAYDDSVKLYQDNAWVIRTSAADKAWISVTYGGGKWVAVAQGTGSDPDVVMTSTDGITWTLRTALFNSWFSICYGNGLFVVVAPNGVAGVKIMTSPDGITWTYRVAPTAEGWQSICYSPELNLFVGVASTGPAATCVMTSPDGINWTARAGVGGVNYGWFSVCWGGGQFVAVAFGGANTSLVMTSLNGIDWVLRVAASNKQWTSICYGGGLYIAVANSGVGNRVMSSANGIDWVSRASTADNEWNSVTYNGYLFYAVASTGANRVMISYDGITWTAQAAAAANQWFSVAFDGVDKLVAVSLTGVGNRAMTLQNSLLATVGLDVVEECNFPVYLKWLNDYGGLSTRLFHEDQVFGLSAQELWRLNTKQVFVRNLKFDDWKSLQELNKDGADYGDNKKLGAYVVDFTDEASPINIFTVPQDVATQYKFLRHEFKMSLRYPKLDNIDI